MGYKKFKTQPSVTSVPFNLWDSCPASDSAEICGISVSPKEMMLNADPSGQTLFKTYMAILAKIFEAVHAIFFKPCMCYISMLGSHSCLENWICQQAENVFLPQHTCKQ